MPQTNVSNRNGMAETLRRTAQAPFSAFPVFAPYSEHFLQAQRLVMEETRDFADAWLERRGEAMRSALDASTRIARDGMKSPADGAQAIAEWQIGEIERLAEDGQAVSRLMTRCAAGLIGNEIDAIEESAEITESVASTGHATPV